MVTVKWYWNSSITSTPIWTEFGADDIIGFYGTLIFGTAIALNQYNESMHLEDVSNNDVCAYPHLTNTKYINSQEIQISQGAIDYLSVTYPPIGYCIKIVVSDLGGSQTATGGKIFSHKTGDESSAPTGVNSQALERTNVSWISCGGSGSPLFLVDKVTATEHTYYVAFSFSPTLVGDMEFELKFFVHSGVDISNTKTIRLSGNYSEALLPETHVLAILSSYMPKPILKELSSYARDGTYGDITSPVYLDEREIIGVIITDANFYSRKLRDLGISTEATPVLLVPIVCRYNLGSRIFDPVTSAWYELKNETDIVKHFEPTLQDIANYREYKLERVQEYSKGGP